jgi:hypothetical protein
MRKTLSAVVVAAATTALLLPSASAFAASETLNDSAKDTYKLVEDDSPKGYSYEPANLTLNTDLDKVVVKHTAKRVEIVSTFFTLKKDDSVVPIVFAAIRTDTDATYGAQTRAIKGPEGWQLYSFFYLENAGSRRGTTCAGFKTEIDWVADQMSLSIPRSCMADPTWVQVKSGAGSHRVSNDSDYYDNAHHSKGNEKGWTDRIKKG